MENEAEDEILARALEESLRHYREVELPRLTQAQDETRGNEDDEIHDDIGCVDDWACWEEWDDAQIENAVQVEEAVKYGVESAEPQTSQCIKVEKKQSSKSMDDYIRREVLPRQSNISVGEIGNDGAEGFDKEAGRTWIYPCNFPVREYQLDIVQSALFDNTLVSLPTGLGKTFIAAVVMYNFYRWFPMGKIIFLAPTRPLVAQQIHACYNIMGIPQEDTVELTGSKIGIHRAKAWKEKRVFFATPQVLANDLGTGVCPGEQVRCVVVDEAHRAAGNHAICQSFRSLFRLRDQYPKSRFRVVALSATPGKNPTAVASVVTVLQISKLELRDELSPDVVPYTHRRNLETVVVPLGPELTETRDKFMLILNSFVDRLTRRNLLYCAQRSKLTKFQLLLSRENFRKNIPPGMSFAEKGHVEGDYATSITLVHALGLLLTHGERTFMNFMQGILKGDKGSVVAKSRLCNNASLLSLLSDLQDKLGDIMHQPAPNVSLSEGMAAAIKGDDNGKMFIASHPKMNHLRDIVVKHFESFQASGESTRVMIFCEYRDPVIEICNMLMQHWPLVKPMSFVGQSSSTVQVDPATPGPSRGTKGFTQKQQLQVIQGFREGGYNVLVSTCVGEEGLDIGDVDLIICYDAPHASPLRLVQRMGRTGRKREGRVVTLVTKEVEEQKHRQGLRQKNTIVKSLLTSKALETSLCRSNARVLPPGTNPTRHMMPMTIPKMPEKLEKKKKGKAKTEKSISVEDMVKKGMGRETEEDEGSINAVSETSTSITKQKGRGKNSKRVPKLKPKKGIKEFFNVQKNKVLETSVLCEGDAEDDDFIVPRDPITKSKCDEVEDCGDEVVVIEDDMPTAHHSPPSTVLKALNTNKVDCQEVISSVHLNSSKEKVLFGESVALPSDLRALENSLSLLFGSICCGNLKEDSPYRCSAMVSFFQYRHSAHYSPNILPLSHFDTITADALIAFDVEKEANRIGAWKRSSIFSVERGSLMRDYGPSPGKCGLAGRNLTGDNFLISTRRSPHVMKKEHLVDSKLCDRPSDAGFKTLNNVAVPEVIEIFDSDEEKICSMTPDRKKPAVTSSDNCRVVAKEGLLWNVLGRKEPAIQYKGEHERTDKRSEVEILEKDDLDCKRALSKTSPGDFENQNGILSTQCYGGNSSEVDKIMMKLDPPVFNGKLLSSPDIMEEGYFGSPERTPEKESLNVASVSKDQLCENNALPGQPILASSTPKIHRRNLFSPKACLPSPIGHCSKRGVSAVDLVCLDENFCDGKQDSLHGIRNLPHESSHLNKAKAQIVESSNNDFGLPNFDLGSAYEFSSSSNETIFEPPIYPDPKEVDISDDDIQSLPMRNDGDQLLPIEDDLNTKIFCQEEEKKVLLSSKVEKSSDLFENTSTEVSRAMISRSKFPRQVESTLGDPYDHSFTVTQAVNMLVPSEKSPFDHVKERSPQKRQIESKMQHEKYGSDKRSHLSKQDQLHLSNKGLENADEKAPHNAEGNALNFEKNMSGSLKNNVEKLANPENVRKDVDDEINFDIGDDIFLDLSADLFAEDGTEGEEEKNGEGRQMKSMPTCWTPEVKVNSCEQSPMKFAEKGTLNKVTSFAENEIQIKSQVAGNVDLVNRSRGKYKESAENENKLLSQKSRFEFPENGRGIPGWNADGWLSKGTHSNKNKFSLGLKGIKKQLESEGFSKTKKQLSVGNNSRVHNSEIEAPFKPSSFNRSRGDNWIDDLGTERTVLEAIDELELKQKQPPESRKASQFKKEALIPSDDAFFDFQDPDLFENIVDYQSKSFSDSSSHKHVKSEVENKSVDHNSCEPIVHERSEESEVEGGALQHRKISSKQDKKHFTRNENLLKSQRKDSKKEVSGYHDGSLGDCSDRSENSHQSTSEDGESSDDFEGQRTRSVKRKLEAIKSRDISVSSEENVPIKAKRIRRRRKHEFLDTQAEESFVEVGGRKLYVEEDDDDDDERGQSQYYDPSFINDGGHNSQEADVDMHAKYLQSVRSPRNAKFKIPNLPLLEHQNESFAVEDHSYHHAESDSCYMNDSFCVDSDGEDKEESVDELEVLEAILANSTKDKKIKKRRKDKSRTISDEELEICEVKHNKQEGVEIIGHRKKRKRKRIVVHDSSEDEENHHRSPAKNSMRSEAEIPVIDEKLFEALSQDFEEELHEVDQVGGNFFPSANKECRNLISEHVQTLEKGNESSFDFKLPSEKSRSLTDKNKLKPVKPLSDNSVKNISSCDSDEELRDQKESNILDKKASLGEKGKKCLATNDKFSVNWSSDLFNFSDDEELFSVIKSPPSISKSSSPVKNPANTAASVMSISHIEKNKLNKLTATSVGGVKSQDIEEEGSCTNRKVPNQTSSVGDVTTFFTKTGSASTSSCLQSMRRSESTEEDFCGLAKKRGSVNEAPHGVKGETSVQSGPVNAPSSSHDGPLVLADIGNKKHGGAKEVLVIVSPVEACRASEVMSALRAIKGIRLVVYTGGGSPSVPYSLGRNLCLLRVSAAGLGRNSKASDAVQTAFGLFPRVSVIVEWERESDVAQNNWSKKKSNTPWNCSAMPASYNMAAYIALLNLRNAYVNVLHSSGQVESAKLIAEMARHQQDLELQLNMQPVSLPAAFELSDPVLKFYASLPGINTFQALALWQQFPKINEFLERCSSARSIQMVTYLDLNKALQLHKILANVHVSDT